jgi:hypothetical protein
MEQKRLERQQLGFFCLLLDHSQFTGTVHAWHLDVNVTNHRESMSKNATVLLDNSRSSAQIRVDAAVRGVCAFAAPAGRSGGSIAIINENGKFEVHHVDVEGTITTVCTR